MFNLDQCGGDALDRFRVALPTGGFVDVDPAEDAIAATGAEIRHGGNRAYFDVLGDFVQLPIKDSFNSPAAYYSTALHEIIHWSGHESRQNRIDKLARFGDANYAVEELIAELGAAFLTAAVGIPNERTLDNSTAYLATWLAVLRSDNRAIFTAATAASQRRISSWRSAALWNRKKNQKRLRCELGSHKTFEVFVHGDRGKIPSFLRRCLGDHEVAALEVSRNVRPIQLSEISLLFPEATIYSVR